MSTTKYRVVAVKLSDLTKVIDQPFTTYAAAARVRAFLTAKGYRACVKIDVVSA